MASEEASLPGSEENDTPLTDHQLMELGRISYFAASIESQMLGVAVKLVVRDVLNDEETTRILLRGASMQELQERIAALLRRSDLSEPDRAYIRARLSQAGAAMSKRNHLMHGEWINALDGQVVIQQRRNKDDRALAFRDKEATMIADELSDANEEMAGAFLVAHGIPSETFTAAASLDTETRGGKFDGGTSSV